MSSLRRITLTDVLTKITQTAWALWLGAMIAGFVFGTVFFAAFPHDAAGTAANAMFKTYANLELTLAGISLLSSGLLLVNHPTLRRALVLGCLILTGGMAVTVALGLIPRMDALLAEGGPRSPEFIRWHVKSMIAMTIQTAMLVLVGALILSRKAENEISDDITDEEIGYERRMRN